jgi:hypothetical protein
MTVNWFTASQSLAAGSSKSMSQARTRVLGSTLLRELAQLTLNLSREDQVAVSTQP